MMNRYHLLYHVLLCPLFQIVRSRLISISFTLCSYCHSRSNPFLPLSLFQTRPQTMEQPQKQSNSPGNEPHRMPYSVSYSMSSSRNKNLMATNFAWSSDSQEDVTPPKNIDKAMASPAPAAHIAPVGLMDTSDLPKGKALTSIMAALFVASSSTWTRAL